MKITAKGRTTATDVAFMVTCGAYDDYTVVCVCAHERTARQQARRYNHENRPSQEDARARVEPITFIR